MKISEYTKNEREKLKGQPFKVQLAYYWDYYKWYAIVAVTVLVFVIYTVVTALSQKEIVLTGILIDGKAPVETPKLLQEFYEAEGIDENTQEASLITGLSLDSGMPQVVTTTYQRIHAGIGAEDTDFLMGYEYAIQRFAYDTAYVFADLREVLPAETLNKLEGSLYYIDKSVIEKIKNSPQEEVPLPDPGKPEEMEEPIPVAVKISNAKEFTSAYFSTSNQDLYIGVVVNAPHKEKAARFIELLIP